MNKDKKYNAKQVTIAVNLWVFLFASNFRCQNFEQLQSIIVVVQNRRLSYVTYLNQMSFKLDVVYLAYHTNWEICLAENNLA